MNFSFDYHTQYLHYRKYINQLVGLSQLPAVAVWAELGITLFVIAFFVWFAIKPTATTIASLLTDIQNQKQISATLGSKIDSLAAAQATYLSIKPQLDILDQSLPSSPNLAEFSWQLEMLSAQTGTQLENLNFEPIHPSPPSTPQDSPPPQKNSTTAPSPKSVGFDLRVSGNYSNLRQLTSQLGQIRRLVSFSSLSIQTRPKDTILKLYIIGAVHYF